MGHLCICVPSWSPIIQRKAAFPKIEAVCSYVTDKALSCSPSSCCPHRSLAWNDVLFCLFSAICFQTTSFFLYLKKKKICQSCFLSTWSCCYCFHWVGFLLFMISETRRWNETQSIFSTSLISISGMHLVELRFLMAVVFTGMSDDLVSYWLIYANSPRSDIVRDRIWVKRHLWRALKMALHVRTYILRRSGSSASCDLTIQLNP